MRLAASAILLLAAVLSTACDATGERLRLATTTSTQDSGLLEELLPVFERQTGLRVDVIAVGTGAAFRLARDGNADLLLVHDREGEEAFIAERHGRERRDLMWNTFEILGPADDPAGTRGATTGSEALRRIAEARAAFVSRGDDSGTHRRERSLWAACGAQPGWAAYRESGQGMGATLRIADELGAYVLTDRGTRVRYAAQLALVPLVAETPDLRNEYGVVLLDRTRHPEARHAAADRLAEWLTGTDAARRIAAYSVRGATLFQPHGEQ